MGRKIIITVLSQFQSNPKTISYRCDKGDPIEADWTNEAGLKYLLRNEEKYTHIICLCSEAILLDDEKYKNRIKEIIKPYDIEPVYVSYSINDDVKDTSQKLKNQFGEFRPSDTVYIDTTGGARTVTYYLVYLFRYLEYIGVEVKSAIYSQFDRGENNGNVKDVKDNFRMFDLINGAHEFTSTGNPRTLAGYFSESKNKNILNLLDAMDRFYDQISLCRIGDELDKALEDMDKNLQAIENGRDVSGDVARLKEFIPVIKNKFFLGGKSKYLGLMKWCLDNRLLQQALTMYVEKLPRAYFTELGFFDVGIGSLGKPKNEGQDIYSEYFMDNIVKNAIYGKNINTEINISKMTMTKICFDYSYAKTVRNYVNHASEKKYDEKEKHIRKLREENKELYKFPDNNSFSAKDIESFIMQSLKYIENIKLIKY